MAQTAIYSISNVILSILPSDPPQLAINVTGMATTPGWWNPELIPLEQELSPDGILDLAFVAEPPQGLVFQALTPISASIVIRENVDRIVGVRIVARSGDRFALLRQRPAPMPQPSEPTTPDPLDPEAISQLWGRELRVFGPGDPVMPSFNPERVNIDVDGRRRITRVWFG